MEYYLEGSLGHKGVNVPPQPGRLLVSTHLLWLLLPRHTGPPPRAQLEASPSPTTLLWCRQPLLWTSGQGG